MITNALLMGLCHRDMLQTALVDLEKSVYPANMVCAIKDSKICGATIGTLFFVI